MNPAQILIKFSQVLFLLALGIAWSRPARGANIVSFVNSGQNLSITGAQELALGDLDGDGDLDAYVIDHGYGGGDSVWLNDCRGRYSLGGRPYQGPDYDVKLGDLDRDGDLDAFLAQGNDGTNDGPADKVLLNDGQGHFTDSGQSIGGNFDTRQVQLGDVDRDGDLDALLIRGNLSPCEIWVNDGAGHFTSGQVLNGSGAEAAALGDLNGDGYLDAFIKVTPLEDPTLVNAVWLNDGHGNLVQSGQILSLSYRKFASLLLGDMDGDGDLDAVNGAGLSSPADRNEVWINNGAGQFSRQAVFGDLTRYLVTGDVDNDGDLDVLCGKSYPNYQQLWLNDGRGNLADSGRPLDTNSVKALALGDLDADGDLDVFCIGANPALVFFNFDLANLSLAPGWQLQNVDRLGLTGRFPSLALDGQQRPHLAYWDGVMQSFRYAYWDGVAWNLENVEDTAPPRYMDEKQLGSLAIDSYGRAHLACVYGSRMFIIWDDHDAGGHVGPSEPVFVPPGGDCTISFTPDPGYHVQAVLVDDIPVGTGSSLPPSSYTFRHVTENHRIFVNFASGTITPPGPAKPNRNITIDPIEIGHYAEQLENVRYLLRDHGRWSGQTVADFTAGAPVLGLGPLNQPVIGFLGAPRSEITLYSWNKATHQTMTRPHIARQNPTTAAWSASPRDISWLNTWRFDMALDAAGLSHIAATNDTSTETLYYIHDNGTSYLRETLPASQYTENCKIAVDRAGGVVHLAYLRRGADTGYLAYTYRDATGWHPEERIADGRYAISLALDAYDQPHIAFVEDEKKVIKLASRQAGRWQVEAVAAQDDFYMNDRPLSLKYDVAGNPWLAVFQRSSENLLLLTRAPNWQVRPVDTLGGPVTQTSLDLNLDTFHPSLAYWSRGEGLKYAAWTGQPDWNIQVVAPGTDRGQEPSLKLDSPNRRPHISYYNGDTQQLEYAEWNGSSWAFASVDLLGATGHSSTLFLEPNPRIVYWESTLGQVRLADKTGLSWQVHPNPYTVGSNPASGGPRAAMVNYDQTAASYYDADHGDVRLAFWNNTAWSDEAIDAVTAAGRVPHAIAYDNYLDYIYVAYADANGHALKLAKRTRTGSTWNIDAVTTFSDTVTDLSLFLQAGSYPALGITLSNGELRLAHKYVTGYGWVHEVVDANDGLRGGISQLGGDRERFAYYFQGASRSELRLAFRTSTLPNTLFSPLRPCTGTGGGAGPAPRKPRMATLPQPGGGLYELDILRRLRDAFAATPGGQYYIDLYYKHALETGALGAADSQLLSDSLTVLENLLPGFQAFAEGKGYQAVITQEMVDGVKDILDRLAAAGSPALAQAIQAEYAKYHNLQDFVGLNFNQWGAKLGAAAPVTEKTNIIQFLLGQQPDGRGLDQNGDGLVDIADLITLLGAKAP